MNNALYLEGLDAQGCFQVGVELEWPETWRRRHVGVRCVRECPVLCCLVLFNQSMGETGLMKKKENDGVIKWDECV